MSYLKTEEVKVFPSTRRVNKQTSARLITEQSMVGLINQLVDSDGFVITTEVHNPVSSTDLFEFNVHGYYFSVNLSSLLTLGDSWTDIWGIITLDVTNDYTELVGQDATADENPTENSVFQYEGIDFQSSASASPNTYSLHLLTKSGSTWTIPADSRIKFIESSLDIDIDGGVIS